MTVVEASDAAASAVNCLRLEGRLVARDVLRYTPAGLAICTASLEHESHQQEAGGARQVVLGLTCRFAGELAQRLVAENLGTRLMLQGFLAHRRIGRDGRGQGGILLHVTHYTTRH
ncbi:MAG: primosomal replication protein N [Burkholderiaceae bacterium]